MDSKNLYIIAGCNGAGKTTACFTILPEIIDCKEYINADEIARGLSPFQPENVSFQAGRIMLHRINELLKQGTSFGFETTLSTKSYREKILYANKHHYEVTIFYFWLQNVTLAKERVKIRVAEGGHNIAEPIIERRYEKSILNLIDIYMDISKNVYIFDNSKGRPDPIAQKTNEDGISILNEQLYQKLLSQYDKFRATNRLKR